MSIHNRIYFPLFPSILRVMKYLYYALLIISTVFIFKLIVMYPNMIIYYYNPVPTVFWVLTLNPNTSLEFCDNCILIETIVFLYLYWVFTKWNSCFSIFFCLNQSISKIYYLIVQKINYVYQQIIIWRAAWQHASIYIYINKNQTLILKLVSNFGGVQFS